MEEIQIQPLWQFSENASFLVQSVGKELQRLLGLVVTMYLRNFCDKPLESGQPGLLALNLTLASTIPELDPRFSCNFTSRSAKLSPI